MDLAEIRRIRADVMEKHDPVFLLLRPKDKQDVIDGKCAFMVHNGVPILDYANPPWFGDNQNRVNG